MRKFALIAGNGGSGGLMAYIKGLLKFTTLPNNVVIKLYCGEDLYEKLIDIPSTIEIIPSKDLNENGLNIILDKPLGNKIVDLINSFDPEVVYFINGYTRRGLEKYNNVMVLHNQLHIDNKQIFRESVSLSLFKKILFRAKVRKDITKADGVIFLSEFSLNQTIEMRFDVKNPIVIQFGFEEDNRINKVNFKQLEEPINFIYVSAIYPYKNHIEVVKALKILKEMGIKFKLHLIGQADAKTLKKLKKEIEISDMNKLIYFHEWIEHENIKSYIDNTDIFIYASSIETTGYGLLEGMARGAVIMSSDSSGFPSLLKDGGVYFDPKNITSIVDVVKQLISDSEKRFVYSKKALEYSKDYSWEKSNAELINYLLSFRSK